MFPIVQGVRPIPGCLQGVRPIFKLFRTLLHGVRPIFKLFRTLLISRVSGLFSSRVSDPFFKLFRMLRIHPTPPLGPSITGELAHRLQSSPEAPKLAAHHRRESIDECAAQEDPSPVRLPEPPLARRLDLAWIGWRSCFSTEGGT